MGSWPHAQITMATESKKTITEKRTAPGIRERVLRETTEIERDIRKELTSRYRKSHDMKRQIKTPWWVSLFFLSVAVLVTILFAELALRMLPPSLTAKWTTPKTFYHKIQEDYPRGLFSLNANTGWLLMPKFSQSLSKDGMDFTLHANLDGIRDRDYGAKKPGDFRILGLGDDFALGWGVDGDETFFKLLEYKMNAKPSDFGAGPPAGNSQLKPPHFEVINAGIPRFSTYEEINFMKSIGHQYEPDIVILAFYEGNDYSDNRGKPKIAVMADGYLSDLEIPQSGRMRKYLNQKSMAAKVVNTWIADYEEKCRLRENLEKTEEYLLDIKALLDAKYIPMLLVYIPTQDQSFYRDPLRMNKLDHFLDAIDLFKAREELQAFCEKSGIYFYKLSESFEDDRVSENLRLKDAHLNRLGHAFAAEEIYDYLHKEILRARSE